MDRLEQWRIFVTVAGLRSFVEAARSLRCSPQAVTRAVAALEDRLGTRLLNRTTRSVSLTNDGELCLERGRRALADFESLEQAPSSASTSASDDNELRGVVSMTAPVLFGQLHVVPVITELLALHPRLDARLVLLDRVVSLAEEGIDVGVRIGPLPDSSLRARLVGHVRSVVCASPKYLERAGRHRPRSPEALREAEHACIAFTGTTPIADRWSFRRSDEPRGNRNRERGRAVSVSVRPRLTVNTGQAAIDAALAGLGIVRVLSYQVDQLVADGKLVVLLRPYEPEPVPVHLVQLAAGTTVGARAVTAFMNLAAERLRAKL